MNGKLDSSRMSDGRDGWMMGRSWWDEKMVGLSRRCLRFYSRTSVCFKVAA